MNKRIGLIDADLIDGGTRLPNLALMKLSAYFKANQDTVKLIERVNSNISKEYDEIYISKVFDYTNIDTELLQNENVFYGGSGFFFDKAEYLPYEIEHIKPDYHLYDSYSGKLTDSYRDYSIGFTTRGCFRKCKFCINQNSDKVKFHSHVSEWLDEDRKYIYLLDDNILGYKDWEDVFTELKETGKPFSFRQGLDIRLLTKEKAEMLNGVKYKGEFIFAFDDYDDKDIIVEKLKLWRKYSKKSTKLYVLSGFKSQDENEIISIFERIKILGHYKCLPYIMKHKDYQKSKYKSLFVQIARWCNMPRFFKKMTFRQFCEANQAHKKTDGLCSSMRALKEFENDFPEIAKKYFDTNYWEKQ